MITTTRLLAPAGVLALSLLAGPALGQDETGDNKADMRCFNGYGYTLEGGDYRYTEHHEQHLSGGKVTTWDVDYVGVGGDVIATKHMDFTANPTVPTYTLRIPASGYQEGIHHDGSNWTMFRKQSSDAKEETKSFKIEPPMAADSGFNALAQKNFDKLEDGTTLPFKFVAAGRQGVINLKASQSATTTFEGKKALVFDAQLDMFLINYFVDSLKLTYDPDSKQLLEYRGIGNMHGDDGEVYPVRVTYASQMPDVARRNGAPAAGCGSVDGAS